MIDAFYPITGLLEKIIDEIHAENRRKHAERMEEIKMISDSSMRDVYVQQLLLDKFLAPVENAQYQIQNAAKHAQYLAETVNYYYQDHGANLEDAKEISRQFRALAVQLSQIESLYELKTIYQAITFFSHQLSRFKHREIQYSWEREIRQGILEPLNTCIAVEKNFQRRISFMGTEQYTLNTKTLESSPEINSSVLQSPSSSTTNQSEVINKSCLTEASSKFSYLPQEVQSLIAQNASNTVSVQTKGGKHGERYKCYDSRGRCIGRIKGQPGARYWEADVGQYDSHHAKKVDPLDIAKGIGITFVKSF